MTMDRVVSNIAPTVAAYVQTLQKFIGKINYVFSENVEYEAGSKKWRSENAGHPSTNTFPLFIFNRSVIRYSELGAGRRNVVQTALLPGATTADPYTTFKFMLGEIDINFLLVDSSFDELENFEISYMTEVGQPTQKEFSYQLPTLGDFRFFTKFEPLEGIEVVIDQNHYKGLTGKINIRGFYFVATGTGSRIQQIDLALKNLINQATIDTVTLT